MYQKILLTLDGSELAGEAIEPAADVAATSGGHLVLLDIVPEHRGPFPFSIEAWRDAERHDAEEYLQEVKQRLAAKVPDVDVVVAEGDKPGQTIVDVARRLGCDAVVMATHDRTGLRRMIQGSVSSYVSQHMEGADVLLVRPGSTIAMR